ncbi:hypothetical protein [Wolbachia endosymbiont of Brugia pahangi]|uniref:hypothetical protein n=1 Tax=Wolbachia endosymbiont of Brugia pahangi TaxID=96495 RepID=UPI00143BC7E9|nr:hypothetical protein [Wolbachia endosymbiont of Brugia pahangi]
MIRMCEKHIKVIYCSIVILGNRIGRTTIGSVIDNEYGRERFNIRVIVVDERVY